MLKWIEGVELMFTKDDVFFEDEDIFVDCFCKQKEEIVAGVYETVRDIADKLNITTLNSVRIKDINLYENNYGNANFVGDIELSYVMAVNLCKNSLIDNEELYKKSLATIWHELYHISDIEKVYNVIVKAKNYNETSLKEQFRLWTEFFSTYQTYEIQEDMQIYDSFYSVFNGKDDIKEKLYYTSRIFAYYLKPNHNKKCDELITSYLNINCVADVKEKYQHLLSVYPLITEVDLAELERLINSALEKNDLSGFEPINMMDWLSKIKIKQ